MIDIISIIVPIYNSSKYLNQCIDSIINQTYENIEILLINDGSTDNSLEICNEYKKKDKRIKVINKKNTGVSDCRNIGIRDSIGKYLVFIDSDDFIENNMIELLYKSLLDNNVDVVMCNYIINGQKDKIGNLYNLSDKKILKNDIDDIIYHFLTNKDNIPCYIWRLIINKDKIIEFDINLFFMEDTYFFIKLIYNIESIYFLNKNLYNYRYNELSVSKNIEKVIKNINGMIESEKKIKKFLIDNNKYSVKLDKSINSCIFMLIISKLKLFSEIDMKKNKKIIFNRLMQKDIRDIINNSIIREVPKKIVLEYIFMKLKMYRSMFIILKIKKIINNK